MVDGAKSPQIVVDGVDLFVEVEPPNVQSALVGCQVIFVEPPQVHESHKVYSLTLPHAGRCLSIFKSISSFRAKT